MTLEQQEKIETIIAEAEEKISSITGQKCNLIYMGAKIRISGVDKDVILSAVVRVTGFTFEQLLGKSRYRPLSEARQLTMKLLRTKGKLTYTEIGSYLGGRDHSTILYGCALIENLLSQSFELRQMEASILNELATQKYCAVNLTK